MDKEVVKELIQDQLTSVNLVTELRKLLSDEKRKAEVQKDYQDLKTLLAAGGHASAKAAKSIIDLIS
jgi:lipid-A-disaccharide synthase